MSDVLQLSFPPKALNPNNRKNNPWPYRNAAKKYREECHWLALLAKRKGLTVPEGPCDVFVTFYPPDRRKRDKDNMSAAFKPGQDGIAEAFGVDDFNFNTIPNVADVVKGGRVDVFFRPKRKDGDNFKYIGEVK